METQQEEQVTYHKQFDVKSLDSDGQHIVYEQGGHLHLFNPETNEGNSIAIFVSGDMNFSIPRWEEIRGAGLQNPSISPSGKRAIFEYRGEIVSFPAKEGSWYNLTNKSGVADRSPVWSPKGDKIAWFSDESGEYQLTLADQYGDIEKTYPLKNPTFYFRPSWSPDGKMIAYTDTDFNVWVLELGTGAVTKIDSDLYAHPNRTMNPQWSPDSKWIAYVKQQKSHFKGLYLHSIESGITTQISDPLADIISPVWDASGKYIYALASTDYGLNSGWLDMSSYDPQVNRSLYAVLLSKEISAPTIPKSDNEKVEEKEEKEDDDNGDQKETAEKEKDIVVDLDGIAERFVALSLESGNYIGLAEGPENHVFVWESKTNQPGATVHDYDLNENEAKEFATGVVNMVVSQDRKNALIRKGSSWMIVATSSPVKGSDGALKMDAHIKVDPRQEYHQIFKEGWRYMRDFLYVSNVHGAPWNDVYEWYAPWVDYVRHRSDLNYVVDILSGEVAIGHSYVSGGDMPDLDFVPTGLLGCDLETDGNYYRIAKIYDGEKWNPNLVGPLSVQGLEIAEGDYLFAINGQDLTSDMNPYALLEHSADKTIRIKVGKTADPSMGKMVFIRPVRSENQLRTYDWIESNRKKVDELSGGKLGYVYVPNTGGRGFQFFNRYYFSQQDKKGVVIDERNNGGGSAADYMIDIMNRKLFGFFNSKASTNRPWTTPMAGIWGPKVMIINERAGSGGDLLPYMFKEAAIGPLVGTRTWGGLVGTWDTPRFIDGGRMVAPRGGFYDVNGEWAVEGEGVAPDLEVIQDPQKVMNGGDPQLEAAVKVALDLLKDNEFQLKPEPPAPVRWKRPEGFRN
jgi:tricorn protease